MKSTNYSILSKTFHINSVLSPLYSQREFNIFLGGTMAYTEQNLAVFHSQITGSDFRRFSIYNGLIRNHSLLKITVFAVLLCLFGWCNYHAGMPLLCLSFVIPGLLLPFVYIFRYLKSVNRQIETLALSQVPKEAYTVGFTKSGIWIHRGTENVTLDWEHLDSAVRSKDATYLYYMKNRALILPDSSITLSDIPSFKALLSEKLGCRYKAGIFSTGSHKGSVPASASA